MSLSFKHTFIKETDEAHLDFQKDIFLLVVFQTDIYRPKNLDEVHLDFQKGSRPPPGCYNGSSLALRSPEIFINQRNETGFGIILSVEFSNVHCLHHLKQKWKNMDLKLMSGKSVGSIQGKVRLQAGFVSYSWSN